jgi:hypothetical protein
MNIFLFFILIIFLFIIYKFYFYKNIIENFLVTHIKSECTWETQGELRCSNVPDFNEIPIEQIQLSRLKNKKN